MAEKKTISEKDLNVENPTLKEKVEKNNPLKEILVEYVGNKLNPENDDVTVEMILNTMAEEFPESLLSIAEENWIRGYHQALDDVSEGVKMAHDEKTKDN